MRGVALLVLLLGGISSDLTGSPKAVADDELADRLRSMVWYHGFGLDEMAEATGLAPERVAESLDRLGITVEGRPEPLGDGRTIALPYPGGRHPRIGFRDGAIDPRADTKATIVPPWGPPDYVVVDLPEAVWWEDRLLFLAHTHLPTLWTEAGIELDPRPWVAGDDGSLENRRVLPNGVAIEAKVVPTVGGALLELSLTNGGTIPLRRLRAQVCVLLRGAAGFDRQADEAVVLRTPFAARRSEVEARRWIVTAWDPCHRAWANAPCPCLHSDPAFPDCPPGATVRARGFLAFVEADDADSALCEAARFRARHLDPSPEAASP